MPSGDPASLGTSQFSGISVDASGNAYVVGQISGTSPFTFGSATVTGVNRVYNAVIVKYSSSGAAQWAAVPSGDPAFLGTSQFNGISVDASGNAYAVGVICDTSPFTFGSSTVTISGVNSGQYGANAVIVKYSSSGVAQWASTPSVAPSTSGFYGVSVDASGSAYAVGNIVANLPGTSAFTFGTGVTAADQTALASGRSYNSGVLVKYDSSTGVAQWARAVNSPVSSSITTMFMSVAADLFGNVYVGGYHGFGTVNYGNGITTTGLSASWGTQMVVKYNSSGLAQWASAPSLNQNSSVNPTYFNGIGVSALGDVYAVGGLNSTATFDYGGGVTATGAYGPGGANTVILNYVP